MVNQFLASLREPLPRLVSEHRVDSERDDMLAQARAGRAAAFELLIRPLIEPAYRLAFADLRHRDAAEDAVQEATLKAWSRLGQFRNAAGSLRPWFLKIVANECHSVRRTRWWRLAQTNAPSTVSIASSEDDLAGIADLRRSMRRLDHDERLLLHLFYWLDLSVEDMAQVLQISKSAARGRLYRAVGRLRRDLLVVEEETF